MNILKIYIKEKQHYTDPDLITLWQQGDTNAFDILYKRYVVSMVNTAASKTGSLETAKELVQDVFMEVYLHRNNLQPSNTLHGYLFTALKNKILNHHRNELVRWKHEQSLLGMPSANEEDAQVQLEQKELAEKLYEHIRELPPQCRTVFLMSREDQLSNREIAEKLGISVNTVEQHIRKALRILRTALDDSFLSFFIFCCLFYSICCIPSQFF
jgi:RNA polymerase sigma-70 factor (ECF subfamily)